MCNMYMHAGTYGSYAHEGPTPCTHEAAELARVYYVDTVVPRAVSQEDDRLHVSVFVPLGVSVSERQVCTCTSRMEMLGCAPLLWHRHTPAKLVNELW